MEPYKSSDTPYAAFLHYHKHQVVTVREDPNDMRRKVFVFVEKDETKKLEKEFYEGEPTVNPLIYYKSVRFVYSKLREFKK
jgi:hypothetical protein